MAQVSVVRLFLIASGSFLMYFSSWGMAQSFGIMYIELLQKFEGTKGETTWVQSLFGGVLLASGPIAGILLRKYGCRVVGVCGSLFLTIGLIASVFTPSLYVLYLTYGVVGGFGGSLLFTTAGVVILENFDKRRSLMTGICFSGASTGTILIPLITRAALDEFGFRGTFLLLSGLPLQCLVAALTFVPRSHQTAKSDSEIQNDQRNKKHLKSSETFKHPLTDENHKNGESEDKYATNDVIETETDPLTLEIQEHVYVKTDSVLQNLRTMFAFFNIGYILFALSWALLMLSFLVPFLFLPVVALSRGVSEQEVTYIASSLGIGSIVGTAGFGFLGDIKRLETTLIHTVPVIVFATLTLISNFISGFAGFFILSVLIGLMAAIFDGIHPVITLQLVDKQHLSIALGVLYFLMSISTFLGTPIAGWIADAADRYDETFYYCAGLSYFGAVLSACIPVWKRNKHINIHENNNTKSESI